MEPDVKLENLSIHNASNLDETNNMTLILNESEYVENLYRRYYMVRIDAMIEVVELLNICETTSEALGVLQTRVTQMIHKATDNTVDIHSLCTRLYKRGNPRKMKVNI